LLVSDSDFIQDGDLFYYASKDPNIHRHVSLNSIDESSYQLFHGNQLIETMDQLYAYRDTHFHAIYLHKSEKYRVTEFDDTNKIIRIQRTDDTYRTKSIQDNQISIIREIYKNSSHSIDLHYGFVNVTKLISGYQVIQDDQVIQTFSLDLPPIQFLTKGTWFDLSDDMIKKVEQQVGLSKKEAKQNLSRSIAGICNVISDVAPSFLLCDARDIGVGIDEQQDAQTIVIYDDYKGGIGLSEKCVPLFPQIIKMAYDIVNECSCKGGCPKCILSHNRNIRESMLTKKSSIIILKLLLEKIT
jgi:DEAD/DEAH box helicase domain-containing protein